MTALEILHPKIGISLFLGISSSSWSGGWTTGTTRSGCLNAVMHSKSKIVPRPSVGRWPSGGITPALGNLHSLAGIFREV